MKFRPDIEHKEVLKYPISSPYSMKGNGMPPYREEIGDDPLGAYVLVPLRDLHSLSEASFSALYTQRKNKSNPLKSHLNESPFILRRRALIDP